MAPNLKAQLAELREVLHTFESEIESLTRVGHTISQVIKNGGKVLSAGNGGSAADASHLCEELTGRYREDRKALPAICLNTDGSALTCIANDYGFGHIFSRQIEALGKENDVFVAFSTSGNSQNIIQALETARGMNLTTVLVTGMDGGAAAISADHLLSVPSPDTARIQEVHTFILHSLLEIIESDTF